MLIKLLTYKTLVVTFLLTAISGVYVCEILCDLDIYSMKRACHSTCARPDVTSSHQHNDGETDHHYDKTTNDLSFQYDESKGDHLPVEDCCDDMTSMVFDSFYLEKVSTLSFEIKPVFLFDIPFKYNQLVSDQLADNQFKFTFDKSPPPNRPDIFIMVGSLLI